ncbi:unnamed protein product [Prorocentrum cordatum]|uniref:Fibronectin type-III domain-containing protein n=1 Tax=Prorocentrum cordatum TaxID=2364126 RepID=A0ABN9VBU8_9DINO|nr:unnamed protein product [Polarella glacialis]
MGPSYRAQISVKDGEKWSAYSDLCEPCVISNPEPPAAPMLTVLDESSMKISWLLDDLGCEPKPTRVSIAWTNTVGGPGITYLDKHGGHHTDKVPTIDTGAKEVIVKFLRTNVPYQAQMAVQNAVGWSKYSPFCPPDKISKPIQLDPPVLEVVHGDRIQVIWEPPRLGLPCTAYAVALNDGKVTLYLDAKGAPHDNKDNASIIPATQTSIMVPLLLENVPYKAQVASRNALGWGPYSAFSKTETVVKEKKKAPLVATEEFHLYEKRCRIAVAASALYRDLPQVALTVFLLARDVASGPETMVWRLLSALLTTLAAWVKANLEPVPKSGKLQIWSTLDHAQWSTGGLILAEAESASLLRFKWRRPYKAFGGIGNGHVAARQVH